MQCVKEIKANEEKRRGKTKNDQPKIQQAIERSHAYPRDSSKRNQIDEALIKMIATDLQPISIVEDKGFQTFVHTLDGRYEIPSRRTLMSKIPEIYESVKTSLRQRLHNATQILFFIFIFCSNKASCISNNSCSSATTHIYTIQE